MACNLLAGGRPPSSSEDSLETDARIDEAHWLPPANLGRMTGQPNDDFDWFRPESGEEEDLQCPPLLEPHLQELLGGEEPAGTKVPYDPAACIPCIIQNGYNGVLTK